MVPIFRLFHIEVQGEANMCFYMVSQSQHPDIFITEKLTDDRLGLFGNYSVKNIDGLILQG